MPNSEVAPATPDTEQSALRGFLVLIVQSFQRHWRVRQMGWVSLSLLSLVVAWVLLVSASPAGWNLPGQRVSRTRVTNLQYAERLLPQNRYDLEKAPPLAAHELPTPVTPTRDALQSLLLSIPYVILQSERFLADWGFMNFSRWVILGAFLGFVLPLFTLSYATAAFGTDRESRSLVWLMTRPIPRSGIYVAKFLGTLPWCTAFSLGGFVALGMAGGELGRRAIALYWPAAVGATLAFAALFHLIGAIFRRPVVVGLVYVFFFEALVAALPGSLKLLSLTFYARSLMYNAAVTAGYPADMLDVPQAVTSTTAWSVLAVAIFGFTTVGMWLFARSEYRDDV